MSLIEISKVSVLSNPSSFNLPFQFEITLESHDNLPHDLQVSLIYVGNYNDQSYDQTLADVLIGPITKGPSCFILDASAPCIEKIPPSEILGVTCLLISCSYLGQKFIQIGYYVRNEIYPEFNSAYYDPQTIHLLSRSESNEVSSNLQNNLLQPLNPSHIQRSIHASHPIVTRYSINWEDSSKSSYAVLPLTKEEEAFIQHANQQEYSDIIMDSLDEEEDDMEEDDEDLEGIEEAEEISIESFDTNANYCSNSNSSSSNFSTISSNSSTNILPATSSTTNNININIHLNSSNPLQSVKSPFSFINNTNSTTGSFYSSQYNHTTTTNLNTTTTRTSSYILTYDNQYFEGMPVINEDSNSLDISRMIHN